MVTRYGELINYLKIINYKIELPKWLLDMGAIKLILINIEKLSVEDMIVDLENKEEINSITYMAYRCEKILGDKFNQVLSKIKISGSINKEVSVDDLFKKYSEKSSTYNLIEGRIKKIEKNRVVLDIEDRVEAILTDYYDIGDKSKYKIGDRIGVCILDISKNESKLEIDVYRNSAKCMYESICKLNIPSLVNIKKSNIEIINNEELFITNYVGKENIKTLENNIKDRLVLNNVKILDLLNSKIKNIAIIFNISEDSINKVNDNEYIIKVFEIEDYKFINRLFIRYKKLLQSIGIKSVSGKMVSIKSKFNLYKSKMNKLIECKIKEVNDNEYIMDMEDNVKCRLTKINANQKYSIGSMIIAKVESISLGNDCIYLSLNNIYEAYIKDLIEYKIKQLNISNMIDKVDILTNINKIYNVKFILNEGYDQNLINTLKNDIEITTNKRNIVFSTIVKNTTKEKDTVKAKDEPKIINDLSKTIDVLDKSNENLYKDISISEIIKMFNRKKKECDVPEIRILKNARIEKYKIVIICSKLTYTNKKINLASLEYDMGLELNGEKIKIAVYDEDIKSMVSDIMEIEKKDIEVDKNKRNIKINMKEKVYFELDIKKEKTLLSKIFPYYQIEFVVQKESNKESTISKSNEQEEDIDDNILDLLFK